MRTMQQRALAMFALASASVYAVAVEQAGSSAQPAKPAEKKTGYAPVNRLKMYYEVIGEGKPGEVYIHPIVSHCGLIPGLTGNRQWIAMDLQGHGRTADIDRPMTCEQHADDIAALLKHLRIEDADFFGDSVGSAIAVMMAVRHPKLVRRVVSYGNSVCPLPEGHWRSPSPPESKLSVKWSERNMSEGGRLTRKLNGPRFSPRVLEVWN